MKVWSGWTRSVVLALVVVGAPVLALPPGADAATASKATSLVTTYSSNVVDALNCASVGLPVLAFGLNGTGPAFSSASYFDNEGNQIGSSTLKVRFTVGKKAPFTVTIKELAVYSGKQLAVSPTCTTVHKILVQGAADGAVVKAQVVSGTYTRSGVKSTISGTPSASGRLGKLSRIVVTKSAKTGKKAAGGPLWKVTATTQVYTKSGSKHVWKATQGVPVRYTDNLCKADRKVTSGPKGVFSVTVHHVSYEGANELDFRMGTKSTSKYEGSFYSWTRQSNGRFVKDPKLFGGC